MFVDEVRVTLKAGDGGHGCLSFLREKYKPNGGPNGGDGGKGGDLYIFCDDNASDLCAYQFQAHWRAENGEPGRGSEQYGKQGKDCVLLMPPGTLVYDEDKEVCLAELTEKGQKILLLQGGKGGKGNIHFKSSVNQAPRRTEPGELGQGGTFNLVLKTIATVGLVGFPNAGKSSLTNALTQAQRKIGAYPFTTLNPSVGIILYQDSYQRLSIADIPGLIEGAHEDRGLGHRFLRHIERCHVLLFVIDMAGEDTRNPLKDYNTLIEELRRYSPEFATKPCMIAANKMDLPEAKEHLKAFKKAVSLPVYPISCLSGEGLPELKKALQPFAVY